MECVFLLVMIVLASLVHSAWALLRYLLTPPIPAPREAQVPPP